MTLLIAEETTGLVCPRCLKFKTVCVCDEVVKKMEIYGKGNSPLVKSKCEICGLEIMTNFEFDVLCNNCDRKKRLGDWK